MPQSTDATEPPIRDAVPGDRAALIGFMAGLQDFEHGLHPDRAEGPPMAEAHLDYLQRLVGGRDGFVLVAERGGAPVGFLVGIVEALDEGDGHIVEAERRFGYVTDIFVAPGARAAGLGAALMTEAERRFRAAGLRSMAVTYLANNRPAERLYRRVGFEPYEVTLRKPL